MTFLWPFFLLALLYLLKLYIWKGTRTQPRYFYISLFPKWFCTDQWLKSHLYAVSSHIYVPSPLTVKSWVLLSPDVLLESLCGCLAACQMEKVPKGDLILYLSPKAHPFQVVKSVVLLHSLSLPTVLTLIPSSLVSCVQSISNLDNKTLRIYLVISNYCSYHCCFQIIHYQWYKSLQIISLIWAKQPFGDISSHPESS